MGSLYGRGSVALIAPPNIAVSVRGRARVVKPDMRAYEQGAVVDIDIAEVKNDMLVKKCQTANIRDIQLFCARGKREFYAKRGFVGRPEDAPGMQWRRADTG